MKIKNNFHQLRIPFFIPIAMGKQIERFVNIFIIEGEKLHFIDSGVFSGKQIPGGYYYCASWDDMRTREKMEIIIDNGISFIKQIDAEASEKNISTRELFLAKRIK